jgi:hypothetical protein
MMQESSEKVQREAMTQREARLRSLNLNPIDDDEINYWSARSTRVLESLLVYVT